MLFVYGVVLERFKACEIYVLNVIIFCGNWPPLFKVGLLFTCLKIEEMIRLKEIACIF